MSPKQMQANLKFVDQADIHQSYLWGAEWWYWRKIKFHDNGPWQAAKQLLAESD